MSISVEILDREDIFNLVEILDREEIFNLVEILDRVEIFNLVETLGLSEYRSRKDDDDDGKVVVVVVVVVGADFPEADCYFLPPALTAALVTFPSAAFLVTLLMTPTATVWRMSRTANRPSGG